MSRYKTRRRVGNRWVYTYEDAKPKKKARLLRLTSGITEVKSGYEVRGLISPRDGKFDVEDHVSGYLRPGDSRLKTETFDTRAAAEARAHERFGKSSGGVGMVSPMIAKMKHAGAKLARMLGKRGRDYVPGTRTTHHPGGVTTRSVPSVATRGARAAARAKLPTLGRELSSPMVGKQLPASHAIGPKTGGGAIKGPEIRVGPVTRQPSSGRAGPKRVHGGGSGAHLTRSESVQDQAGRVLKKGGLYTFSGFDTKKDARLPDKFLFDYLCSFIEEAYEHERREPAHKNISSPPEHFARCIMGELVQCLPKNPNLMRAAKKYRVTQDVIARLLVTKGILQPQSDTLWTDSDGASAMGASQLAESSPMAYSLNHGTSHGTPYAVGMQLQRSAPDDVARLILDDSIDPSTALHTRKSAELAELWPSRASAVRVTVRDGCPVHDGGDITKAQNLHNAMTPCTCGSDLNPYG